VEYLALLLPACLCWPARRLAAATIAAALVIAAAASGGGTASLVYLIPVLAVTFLLSYRLGNAGGWRTIAGPALLAATAEVVNPSFNPFLLMLTFGPWAAAEFVRSRRQLAAELAEAGELLAAERSRYADEAVRYERVHLARELHDTVAHWLTAVVIQARAGQVRSQTQPESVTATFADIATAAGRADEEITQSAALLGRDGISPDSLAELADHLADAVRLTGTDVTFSSSGHDPLTPALAADALGIIQEGLTNSMKHAPGAPVSVTLAATAAGLDLGIINGPARSAPLELDGSGGAGLPGMTERVMAHGGRLSAGPVPGGGWRITATLPSAPAQDPAAPGPAVAGLAARRSQVGGLARLTAQSLRRDLVGRAERLHR
jgi:signal transduction histidine kinase